MIASPVAEGGDGGRPAGEVERTVREMVATVLSVSASDVDPDLALTDCGVTSVELIDIAVRLEALYAVQFDPADMRALTCRSLAGNVIRLCAGPKATAD
ncbi:MAG: acyl carrier protein [Telmatospirillum sp.]|nr:acyl carrier protein [Telmatospirillum sp.]